MTTIEIDARAAERRERGKQRRAIVRRLRALNGNVARTAREFGVERELVERLRDYHGIPVHQGTGERARGPRKKTRAAVDAALKASGGNVKRVARDLGIAESTVRRWKGEKVPAREMVTAETFYANTQVDAGTSCVIWTGRVQHGYGVLDAGGVSRRAHRVAYELEYGVELGPDDHVHHSCRRTACVNPRHLVLVAPGGEQGHHRLHRYEDEVAEAFKSGQLQSEIAAASVGEWPGWPTDERRIGALRGPN